MRTPCRRASAWAPPGFLVFMLTTQFAGAQTILPAVTVTSTPDKEPSLTQPGIGEARRRTERTPGGANVIDSETYLKGSAVTPADALGYSTGIFVQSRIPGAEESRLSIRGSGVQRTFHGRGLKVLQDGVPVNQVDGAFDMQSLEPLAARYIEVFRGANALQYGSTTLGGAINYVSPSGYNAPPWQLRGELGSYGYMRGQAGVAGVGDETDYYVTATYSGQDGYQDHSKQSNQRLFANLGYRINANLETRFYFSYALSDSELPGSLTKTEIKTNPRAANPGNIAGDQHRDFNLARIANKTTYVAGDRRFEFGAFYVYKALWHPIFQVLDIGYNDYGLDFRYISQAPLGGRRNILTVGFSPVRGTAADDRYQNIGGGPGARTASSDQTAVGLDFYAENQHYVGDRVALVLGAQASRASRRYEDKFFGDGVNNSFDADYTQLSPKAGARYEFTPAVQVFGNVSRSFEPPSFGELAGGPNITQVRKQSAWTLELGSRGTVGRGAWDAAWYRANVKDELLSQNDGNGNPLGTVNAPDTLHQGIELGASWTFFRSWLVRGAYLWNDFHFDGHPVYGDNTLPGIPKQFLRAEALFTTPDGYYAGPGLEWSPQGYPVDMANTLFADAYATLGFKFGQRVSKGVSWFVDGRNLTDRKYAATTGVIADSRSPGAGGQNARQFNPGLGRSVFAGVQWQM
jgi:iron complex outermembrane receptor protein